MSSVSLFQRLRIRLPLWAQPEHPVLRYVLQGQRQPRSRRRRALWLLLMAVVAAVLILLGYQVAPFFFHSRPPGTVHAALYAPLVLVGVLVGLAAMTSTNSVISKEKARGTWDMLRVTSHGPSLTFQTRWVATFYNLRGALTVLVLARVIFVVAVLIDLAQYFRGQYLDLLLSGVTPPVSLPVGAALLAATLTAGVLQPVVAVGLDAAVGLWIGALSREPRYAVLVQAIVGVVRVLLAVLAILIGVQAFNLVPWMTDAGRWGGVVFLNVFGDQGLRLLNLEENGLLWADLDYSVLIGGALLILTLGQAWLANRFVCWAAYLAERVE